MSNLFFPRYLLKLQIMKITLSEGKVHIGLALAGGLTAGAYTAGVLDYLFNTLVLWQERFDKDETGEIPVPNVVIDAMTGSSAGSIAGAVALLGLATGKINTPLNRDVNSQQYNSILFDKINTADNLLYYAWVDMGLPANEKITDKLLSDSDLKDKKVRSLLNANFIEELLERIIKRVENATIKMPEYINPDIEILMTLSNLRGISVDLGIADKNGGEGQIMSYHKAFAHFKHQKKEDGTPSRYLSLNFDNMQEVHRLLTCARASGALPIGLKGVRIIDIPKGYIDENLKEVFKGVENFKIFGTDDDYEFLAVDGGMTNNEPIAEVQRILDDFEARRSGVSEGDEVVDGRNPIILVDPFPSRRMGDNTHDINKDGVSEILSPLYQTLRNQTLFKEKDLLDLLDEDSYKAMILPMRENGGSSRNAIASGALDGFAGFLDRDYRLHDYMLGMKNCQDFLRNCFYQPYEEAIQNEEKWGNAKQKYRDHFKFKDKTGNDKLPIIPDFRTYEQETDGQLNIVFQNVEDTMIDFPRKAIDDIMLPDLEQKIKSRVGKVLKILAKDLDLAWWYRGIAVNILKKRASEYVINAIEDGLKKQGLIK